jgi:hypothetical protein
MRSIKSWLLALSLFGCGGGNGTPVGDPDLGGLCEPAAEAFHGLRCEYGVDTTCHSTVGAYDCQCVCTGYWECDLVKVVCDPDLGPSRD